MSSPWGALENDSKRWGYSPWGALSLLEGAFRAHVFSLEIHIFDTCLSISSSGTIRVSSSRFGRTQFNPEICIRHFFQHLLYLYTFHTNHRFSLISMFWPFSGLLVPTMTSASKNQYRQPRFRAPLSKFDAVYIWSKVLLLMVLLLIKPVLACTGTWPLSAV
jgi:hypothetical protein